MTAGNNITLKWAATLVGVLLVFASIVFGYVRPRMDDHETRIRTLEVYMIEQRTDTKYIKQGIKDIKGQLVKDERR